MLRFLLAMLIAPATLPAGEPAAPVPMTHAVLVHGIWQNKYRCFGFLKHDLEARGVTCLVPSLKPADGRHGLVPLAEQLKSEIDRAFGPDQRFTLVAFSMGGLVSRSYLQDLGGADRCDAFVTISTPHHGTRMAYLHPGLGAEQMRPGSDYLTALEKSADRLGDMPLLSYRTPMDLVIVPTESSIWERAENRSIPSPLHPLMTFSPTMRNDLLRRFSYPLSPGPR